MKFTLSLVIWATLMLLGSACTREIIREVTKTDTLIIKDTIIDTLVVRDTVCANDSCIRSGLLVYYPFSGDFKDASGNGLHLTAMNGASLTRDTGDHANAAALFDGVDDYLFVKDNGKLYSNQFTLSFLFKTARRQTKPNQMFVSHHNFDNATGFHFNAGIDSGRHTGMAVGRPINSCNIIQEYDASIGAPSNDLINEETWESYIGIFDNGKVSVYLNGKLVGSKDVGYYSSLNCSSAQLTLGAWWRSYMNNFYGAMDEFRMHNRALSPCEIAYLSKLK